MLYSIYDFDSFDLQRQTWKFKSVFRRKSKESFGHCFMVEVRWLNLPDRKNNLQIIVVFLNFFSIILCSICLVNKVHSSTWANVRINAALRSYLAVPRHGKRTARNLAVTPKGLKQKRHRHFPADTEDTSSLPSFSCPASFRHPPTASFIANLP